MILVTAKIHPDLDGVACTRSYAELLNAQGRDAEELIFGSPQSEVKYFIERHGIAVCSVPEETKGEWNEFVFVDASSMKGMPAPVVPSQVIEIIDHRAGSEPEKEFPNAHIQNELVGAAATLVTERFMNTGTMPSRENALLLYGAIHHNSLNFVASNTSQRDHDAVAFLKHAHGFEKKIVEEMFRFAIDLILADPARAIEDDGKEFGKGYAVGAYQLIVWGDQILQRRDELEDVVRQISSNNGEQWAILNIIDVASGKGFVYCTHQEQTPRVTKALEHPARDGWIELPHALLRKQIMPMIMNVISSDSERSRD